MKTTMMLFVLAGCTTVTFGQTAALNAPKGPSISAIMRNSTIAGPGAKAATSEAAFYRDTEGRTRIENGSSVVINDPVGGKSYFFDSGSPTQVTVVNLPSPDNKKPEPQGANGFRVLAELGERTFGDVRAKGRRHELKMAAGSSPFLQKDVTVSTEIWFSEDIRLAMHASSTDSLNGANSVVQFDNVKTNVKLSPGLFRPRPVRR